MEEHVSITEQVKKELRRLGYYNQIEKKIDAIAYEFYSTKKTIEDKHDIIIKPNTQKYHELLIDAINHVLGNYRNVIIDDEMTDTIEDDYSEESDAQLRRKPHIIYIEEDIDDFEYDEEYEEIYPQDYKFLINKTLRKESKYKTKEDISKAFKLLLHELLYVNPNATIRQYLTQKDVTYLPEDYQDKNYLLISTLLFKINSFYKGKLNTVMSSNTTSSVYDGIEIDELIYLNQNDRPISRESEIQYDDYYVMVNQNGNNSIFNSKGNFMPEEYCKNIRNAFAHHAWNFTSDGRIHLFHLDPNTSQKDLNLAIDRKNLDATVYAILETCLKDKYKAFYQYYNYMYDFEEPLDLDLKTQEEIKNLVELFIAVGILTQEEVKDMYDEVTDEYDINKLQKYLEPKIEDMTFIKVLSEYIDSAIDQSKDYQYSFSFYEITESNQFEVNVPDKIKSKCLIDAIIITILNTYFVHMNFDEAYIQNLDLSQITPSSDYIKLLEKQRDDQILKHNVAIANLQSDLITYKNAPKKIATINAKILREQTQIETIKQTCENKKKNLNTQAIFTHIRNSLAHGNIKIIDNGKKVVIKDYDTNSRNKRLTFEGTIELDKLLEIMLISLINRELNQTEEPGLK